MRKYAKQTATERTQNIKIMTNKFLERNRTRNDKDMREYFLRDFLIYLDSHNDYINKLPEKELNSWDKLNLYHVARTMSKPDNQGGSKSKITKDLAKKIINLGHKLNWGVRDMCDEFKTLAKDEQDTIMKHFQKIINDRDNNIIYDTYGDYTEEYKKTLTTFVFV